MQGGTIAVRRPRVADAEEPFRSKVLPLFGRRTKELGELLPELYLHGLSLGDFELALRGLLGDGAPLSPSSIARLKAGWTLEADEWRTRRLDDRELVYAWADGVYVKAGLEQDKSCLLVIVGAMRDGRKELLALAAGHRESKESWAAVLRDPGKTIICVREGRRYAARRSVDPSSFRPARRLYDAGWSPVFRSGPPFFGSTARM